ncbi:helix-turn-helix domain-containing protein [Flavobacterium sp. JP2137]|uniref:helix-turn-helix domain-containing protein n=1 Tax=Flavobacterium sp. JP2137 TaxID=3414510 RepID=UPI003D2FD7BA
MQTKSIPVCHINYFNGDREPFYADSLRNFEAEYPLLFRNFKTTFYMLLFVDSGGGTVHTDHHQIAMDHRQVLVIKPGTNNLFSFSEEIQGVFVCFDENFFSMRYHNNVLRKFKCLDLEAKPFFDIPQHTRAKIQAVFELMISEFHATPKCEIAVLRSYLNIVLFELERAKAMAGEGNSLSLEAKSKRMFDFEELVEVHFKQAKTPSFYADRLHLSPNYLNKICKRERGVTAGELIRRRVVLEAQRLLEYTPLNINEISDELHFENASYFVTFFKKNTGFTPEAYRKRQQRL